jgi:putative acetyltransferase
VGDQELVTVRDKPDLDEVRVLLLEYAASLPVPLDFQDFDGELAELPGAYAPPRGALLLARAAWAASRSGRSTTRPVS